MHELHSLVKNQLQDRPDSGEMAEAVRRLSDELAEERRRTATLLAIVERQAATIERVMGAQSAVAVPLAVPVAPPVLAIVPPPVALPCPVVAEQSVGDIWRPYVDHLGEEEDWVPKAESLASRFLNWFSPSTPWRKFWRDKRRPPVYYGPNLQASALRPAQWYQFRAQMIKAGLSVTSRNHTLARAKAMYAWAVSMEIVPEHSLLNAKLEPGKQRRESTLSPEDYERVLAATEMPAFRVYMLSASTSGMREKEARELRWDQIDFKTGRVRLSWTRTKTKKSRNVRLSPRALEAIKAMPRTNEFVIASPRGGPYSRTHMWREFRRVVDTLGIKCAEGDGRIHFHDATRHTFATRFLESGATLKEVQVALGHGTIKTTSLYLHTDEGALDKAHERFYRAERKPPRPTKPRKPKADDK